MTEEEVLAEFEWDEQAPTRLRLSTASSGEWVRLEGEERASVAEALPVSNRSRTEGATMSEFNPMSPHPGILTFDILRKEDASGTSGTGVVAMGVLFPDGTVTVQWQTHVRSVVVYQSMADALYIHGHGDSTGFRFHQAPTRLYLSSGEWVGVK